MEGLSVQVPYIDGLSRPHRPQDHGVTRLHLLLEIGGIIQVVGVFPTQLDVANVLFWLVFVPAVHPESSVVLVNRLGRGTRRERSG